MKKENLLKLATYLMSGDLKADFDMDRFDDRHTEPAVKKTCGTVGCAVGHGPYAGIRKYATESWMEYSNRAFKLSDSEWYFCFGANWAQIDNTAKGAGKRILYLLRKGLPKNWEDQISGEAKLTYKSQKL